MNKESNISDEELDELMEQQFAKQSEIHKVCKMKEKEKQKNLEF